MDFHPEANLVEFVISPARVDAAIEKRVREIAIRAADSFHMTGLLAVELFLLEDGTVLINEVAPRPHNSGHLTIEGHYTNQFEQHLRAILDLPLGSTAQKCPAVMVNIVGAEGHSGIVNYEGVESLLQMPGVTPHIYGKKETRPWRKMGHITCVADSLEDALHSAEIAKDTIRATNL
jgi:5-(carboxyamino)imidazole ribonucleotide synthase